MARPRPFTERMLRHQDSLNQEIQTLTDRMVRNNQILDDVNHGIPWYGLYNGKGKLVSVNASEDVLAQTLAWETSLTRDLLIDEGKDEEHTRWQGYTVRLLEWDHLSFKEFLNALEPRRNIFMVGDDLGFHEPPSPVGSTSSSSSSSSSSV